MATVQLTHVKHNFSLWSELTLNTFSDPDINMRFQNLSFYCQMSHETEICCLSS